MVRKTQVSSRGVVIREIPAPVSPLSKKRRAHDVAKHITKKRNKRKLVIRDDSPENDGVPDTPMASSSATVTSTPIISLVSHVSTISTTTTIPIEIYVTKSYNEEVPISNITANVFDTGENVTMSVNSS
ncbi:unnamed protein product [Lactuca saligna]|uniref:Uncharacterized protein n=1 Tax=Lactuca saligna TaxID=75948 RepID=A0AA35YPI9_LACSI|nr:unnamed protein product [Lactuca saligna]